MTLAYEDVYGKSTAELEADSTSLLDAIHPNDVPKTEQVMERLPEGHAVDIEHRVDPDQGYDRWVWVQTEPIVENGEIARVTGFTRDITDRRRRERQLYVMDKLLRHSLRNDMTTIPGQAEPIENGVRYCPCEEPPVGVALRAGDGQVVVEVQDSAPPIPDNETQVLTGNYGINDVYHSTGLGLWLVYWLVELTVGEITLRSGDDGNRIRLVFSDSQR